MSIWDNLSQKVFLTDVRGFSSLQKTLFAEIGAYALKNKHTIHCKNVSGYFHVDKTYIEFVEEIRKNFSNSWVLFCVENDILFIRDNDEEKNILPAYVYISSNFNNSSRFTVEISSFSKEEFDTLHKISKSYFCEKVDNSVFMLTSSPDSGMDFNNVGQINCPLLRENYEDDIIKSFDYVCDKLLKKGNHGKLVILSGPPGTGKTFFIRGLIEKLSKESMCVIIPNKIITELDGPTIISILLGRGSSDKEWDDIEERYVKKDPKPIVFIAEDCDTHLVPREGSDSSLMSGLLNYTDGIVSELLNVRFIATTNAPHLKIDAALKRPGRLLSHCLIRNLSPQKANEIYQRLTEGKGKEVFEKEVSLAEVYAKANGSEVYDPLILEDKKHKMGFGG